MILLSLTLALQHLLSLQPLFGVFVSHLLDHVTINERAFRIPDLRILLLLFLKLNPFFLLKNALISDVLLLFLSSFFSHYYEALSVVLFVFKILPILFNFFLSVDQLFLVALFFSLLVDQFICEAFVTYPDLVDLPLVLLI